MSKTNQLHAKFFSDLDKQQRFYNRRNNYSSCNHGDFPRSKNQTEKSKSKKKKAPTFK